MACHFEEERFSLGEKSERMVTVTPFMGKLKVHIRQFYVNGNGEIKPGKSGIVLDLKELDKLVELIPQIKESIERYELKDSEIPSSPFQLDLPVLDLDTVFLPSPPPQEPTSIPHDKKLSGNQPKFPSLLFIDPSLENMDDNSPKEQKDKRKRANGSSKKGNKKSKIVKLECIDEVLQWRQ